MVEDLIPSVQQGGALIRLWLYYLTSNPRNKELTVYKQYGTINQSVNDAYSRVKKIHLICHILLTYYTFSYYVWNNKIFAVYNIESSKAKTQSSTDSNTIKNVLHWVFILLLYWSLNSGVMATLHSTDHLTPDNCPATSCRGPDPEIEKRWPCCWLPVRGRTTSPKPLNKVFQRYQSMLLCSDERVFVGCSGCCCCCFSMLHSFLHWCSLCSPTICSC